MSAGPRANWSASQVDGGRAVSDDEVDVADQGVATHRRHHDGEPLADPTGGDAGTAGMSGAGASATTGTPDTAASGVGAPPGGADDQGAGPPSDAEGGSEWSARETVQSDETEAGRSDEPVAGQDEAPGDEAPGDDLPEDALEVACRQRDEYLDALRRLQADFENYRKRVQRQQDESLSRAAERLVSALLPALDAFDLAAAHLVGDDQASPGGLLQAVGLLRDTLAKEGLEQIGAAGDPFDPTAHEAVDHVDDDGGDGPTIDTVLRSGYRFGGRVVRPAMVKVRG